MTKAQKVLKLCLNLSIALAALVAVSCHDKASAILKSEFNSIVEDKYELQLFSDSTYHLETITFDDPIPKVSRGTYSYVNDTLFFSDTLIPVKSKVAVIKNSMLEFPNMEFRLEIISSSLNLRNTFDAQKHSGYHIFTYKPKLHRDLFGMQCKQYDLTDEDIDKIEKLFLSCITGHPDITRKNYNKQCIAVINDKGEKEVWVNCACQNKKPNHLKYHIIDTHDGGDCYLNLRINLTTNTCTNVNINGHA